MRSEHLRIVVHDYLGHPHQVELSRELAHRGHHVLHVYCSSLAMARGRVQATPSDPHRLSFLGICGPSADPRRRLPRRIAEWFYAHGTARAIYKFAADVVLSGNAPPLVQHILSRKVGAATFIYWLQDMVTSATGGKVGPTPFLAATNRYTARVDETLEKGALRRSARIVSISSVFLTRLAAMGIPEGRVHVIENWGPQELLTAVPGQWGPVQDIKQRREPVLLYAGTLDGRHGSQLLEGLARQCHQSQRGVVVLTSEGAAVADLRARVADTCPERLRTFDFQPFSSVPDMLASADLLLVSLSAAAAAMSVPSKVLSYLCVGRPILAAVPENSPVAELVRRSGAGVVTNPACPTEFARVAVDLVADPAALEIMGQAGRHFAERNFALTAIADRFELIMKDVTASGKDMT